MIMTAQLHKFIQLRLFERIFTKHIKITEIEKGLEITCLREILGIVVLNLDCYVLSSFTLKKLD